MIIGEPLLVPPTTSPTPKERDSLCRFSHIGDGSCYPAGTLSSYVLMVIANLHNLITNSHLPSLCKFGVNIVCASSAITFGSLTASLSAITCIALSIFTSPLLILRSGCHDLHLIPLMTFGLAIGSVANLKHAFSLASNLFSSSGDLDPSKEISDDLAFMHTIIKNQESPPSPHLETEEPEEEVYSSAS